MKHQARGLREETIRKLIEKAIQASAHSYSPYSDFKVGAALLAESGIVYSGANMENAGYRATHAEKLALDRAVFAGERTFRAIAIAGKTDAPFYPCGQCLQDLCEFDHEKKGDLIIIGANFERKYYLKTLAEFLTVRFTPSDLGIDPRKH